MTDPIHIISLGAGVQSSTMALMAMLLLILPLPIAAIFADTQQEPLSVYLWLNFLCGVEVKFRADKSPYIEPGIYRGGILGPFIPIHIVTKGDLKKVALTIRVKKDGSGKWAKTVIPTYIANQDGTRGIVQRQCTYDFKMLQIIKEAKRISKEYGNRPVVQWIGISLEEVHRMKDSREPMISHRWPLVDLGMKRHDCLTWIQANGFPKPPRSACTFCPYHSDAEWRKLKTESPEEFQSAVRFERDLQEVKRITDNMRGVPFLHNSLKPLDQIDFSTEEERGQLNMFNNECEGLCGV